MLVSLAISLLICLLNNQVKRRYSGLVMGIIHVKAKKGYKYETPPLNSLYLSIL